LAQGNLVSAALVRRRRLQVLINHLLAGRVPQGATVERAVRAAAARRLAAARLERGRLRHAREVARTINAARATAPRRP
jgi:flagellar P-ring protein precursor FlgI